MEVVWIAFAAAATLVLTRGSRAALATPVLQRTNYAGREVPTAGGLLAVFGFLVAMGVRTLVDFDGGNWQVASIVVVIGFATVGLYDDLVGTHLARGLRGHLRAAAHGQLTSGVTKLVVGVAVALIAVLPFGIDAERRLLAALVVAGSANAANLLDLAPARLIKVAVVVAAALAWGAGSLDPVLGPLMFVAAIAALAPLELNETLMLGDAGANALGGAVGLMAVSSSAGGRVWLWIAAAVVVAINVAGELVSFSRVIERVPPLRLLDQLGRRR